MSVDSKFTIQVLGAISEIGPKDWDACAGKDDPFVSYRFLNALEASGSVGQGTGWQPRYIVAQQDGRTIAVMPNYAKFHSQGEYIFDHNWAHAYENAGGRYYPKLQVAVPFTPATGRRFLVHPDFAEIGPALLLDGAIQLAQKNQISSIHITFCTPEESELGAKMGMMQRIGQQFHWRNQSYETFDNFLKELSSRKRKNIRKERETAQAFGGKIVSLTGNEIEPKHWDAFWDFYQDTGARKWGQPYLTRAFFDEVHKTMRDDILLVLAEIEGEYVAGALNFIGSDTLFGRYWGCVKDFPCLHFELCYYQAIDFAISRGLSCVEAGAQGAHKLARGYLPTPVHSLHWIADPGFKEAVSNFLEAESKAVEDEIVVYTKYGPFKKGGDYEF